MRGSLDGSGEAAGGLSPCVGAPRNKKRFPGRWSLRQLIYSSPLARRRSSGSGVGTSAKVYRKVDHNNTGKDFCFAAFCLSRRNKLNSLCLPALF